VSIEAIPLAKRGGGGRAGFLVLFSAGTDAERPRGTAKKPAKRAGAAEADLLEVVRLRQELTASQEYMQSVIEQQEAANEELQSANEEVQSANEELQSLNEELETSKEEIQSSNEELATVNDELNHRNAELSELNTDFQNLLSSIQTAIVILGPDLKIRRFTAPAARQLGLLPGDVGRPFGDIKLHFAPLLDLEALFSEVIETVRPVEREIHDPKGKWYSLRLRPYRTPEQKIDGVVVMLIDIDTLKRSQQLTANIVDTVREPALVLDADLRVRLASASFYYSFKVTPEETEGRRLYRLGDGQWDIPELRRLLSDVLLKNGTVRNYVVEHEFEHIGRRTMRINARRLHQAEDAEPLILLAIEDDTEKRAAREALQHFRLLFEAAPGSYLVLEPESYTIAAVSDTYLQATHTKREEITGRPLFEVFPDDPAADRPDGVKNLAASLARVKLTRRTDVMAPQLYPIRRPGGKDFEERWWSPVNSPVLGPQGEVIYIIHRVEDITPYINARREEGTLAEGMEVLETRAQQLEADIVLRSHELRRANEELKASTEQYRSLVNQIEDYAIFRTDVSGLAITWNEGVRRVLGLEEADFVGVDVSGTIYTPEDQESGAALRELAEAATSGKVSNDRWMRRKDGTRFYCVGLTIGLRDSRGRLVGFTKVMRDQTDRKELEDELRRRNAEMTEADRHKNEFLAMLAHELRNPLAPMANAVQLLRDGNLTSSTAHLATEIMGRQLGQMTRLVDDLLDVHRISRGTIDLRKKSIELHAVLEQAVEALRPQIEARKQALTVTVPDQAIQLFGDPARLAQVVGNLLGNASKFSPEGGEIGLSAGVNDGHVELIVKDQGMGIPAEETRRIFELFAQADPPAGRARGGIGVGLTLVKELVEMHQGTVEARSEGPGTGSEFVVRLPITER
jgi:PAS domain S-box-containing protein